MERTVPDDLGKFQRKNLQRLALDILDLIGSAKRRLAKLKPPLDIDGPPRRNRKKLDQWRKDSLRNLQRWRSVAWPVEIQDLKELIPEIVALLDDESARSHADTEVLGPMGKLYGDWQLVIEGLNSGETTIGSIRALRTRVEEVRQVAYDLEALVTTWLADAPLIDLCKEKKGKQGHLYVVANVVGAAKPVDLPQKQASALLALGKSGIIKRFPYRSIYGSSDVPGLKQRLPDAIFGLISTKSRNGNEATIVASGLIGRIRDSRPPEQRSVDSWSPTAK